MDVTTNESRGTKAFGGDVRQGFAPHDSLFRASDSCLPHDTVADFYAPLEGYQDNSRCFHHCLSQCEIYLAYATCF